MRELLTGLAIGAAAGIAPGPLLVLVITATLRGGWRSGVLTAMSPLVTDLLVVSIVLVVLDRVALPALYALGIVGGLYVCYLGVTTVREAGEAALVKAPVSTDRTTFMQACVVNVTSPHPWLTWATALGPLTIATYERGAGGAAALVLGFYAALVGAKVLVATLVAGTRHRLSDLGYQRALRVSGVVLAALGVLLVMEFAARLAG